MSHKLKCPEDIKTCDDAIRFGRQQGWEERNGGPHTFVFNEKGGYAVPHGGHRDLSPGVRHAIIKMAKYMLPVIVIFGVVAFILQRLT